MRLLCHAHFALHLLPWRRSCGACMTSTASGALLQSLAFCGFCSPLNSSCRQARSSSLAGTSVDSRPRACCTHEHTHMPLCHALCDC